MGLYVFIFLPTNSNVITFNRPAGWDLHSSTDEDSDDEVVERANVEKKNKKIRVEKKLRSRRQKVRNFESGVEGSGVVRGVKTLGWI